MSAVEKFPILLSEAEEESSAVPPCFSHEGINVCISETTFLSLILIASSTYISDITTFTSLP